MGKEESGRSIPPPPLLLAVLVTIVTATAVGGSSRNCTRSCGEKDVPYPFGLDDDSKDCYLNSNFSLTCNRSFNPPRLLTGSFFQNNNSTNSAFEVAAIILPRGVMRVLSPISYQCYNGSTVEATYNLDAILPDTFALSNRENVFTAVGCETEAWLQYTTETWVGCLLGCRSLNATRDGYCTGQGCCQIDMPESEKANEYYTEYYEREENSSTWTFNRCSYSFPVERGRYRFSKSHITYMSPNTTLPLILDWFIGHRSCEEAAKNRSSYACVSIGSECLNSPNGPGYICNCSMGYEGNPYVKDGCQDIDECKLDRRLYPCQGVCINTKGSYNCVCSKGKTSPDPYKQACVETGQLSSEAKAGIGVLVGLAGASLLLTPSVFLYKKSKKRRERILRTKHFSKNHELLENLVTSLGGNVTRVRTFPLTEMEKATNKFDATRVVGRGGYGTVYKGLLMDNAVVAIKRSNKLDEKGGAEKLEEEVRQFINEVAILSQIDHRNVVRLVGCCLEAEVPLLVYEFISNGTLSDHLHKETRSLSLTWEDRLRIALEIASAIAYMHSAASRSIFHRDLKTSNVLMDEKLTAKVSDFGTSKSITADQTQVATMVQGTFGYLDPQYLHTGLLTEKSDVYSWGVILLELLTGETAFPTQEGNLSSNFISAFKENRVDEIIEALIVKETGKEDLQVLINLAERCLRFKGEERPTMKEVEMVLLNLWSQRTRK